MSSVYCKRQTTAHNCTYTYSVLFYSFLCCYVSVCDILFLFASYLIVFGSISLVVYSMVMFFNILNIISHILPLL